MTTSHAGTVAPLPGSDNDADLQRALALTPYLQRACANNAAFAQRLTREWRTPWTASSMYALLQRETAEGATLGQALRRLKRAVLAQLTVRDLAGKAGLDEVVETMTTCAEVAVSFALPRLEDDLAQRYGRPPAVDGEPQHLLVVGMGKLGGRELNVSSDIDLIFIYPEDGETSGIAGGRGRIEVYEWFNRLGKALIQTLAETTGDGQVFRVDMRLRPNGDSGPLVASLDMLENYFITQGREWERYAWIKARIINADAPPAAVAQLEAVVRPFVFRKYLDFGAINAMRGLHAQIRREVARRDMANNIKLGPGGIREIEFIAQVFQLIRGGRETLLQTRPTREVLKLLRGRSILPEETVEELIEAYTFLRNLEHRLQYLEDQQTHSLPANPDAMALVARGMGFADAGTMMQVLDGHRLRVTRHFEAVFTEPGDADQACMAMWANGEQDGLAAHLTHKGYADPSAAAARLMSLRGGGSYRAMQPQIRERLDALIPRIIEACADEQDPDVTLARTLDLVEAISRRGAYLALLQQYPLALKRVADMVGASVWAAQYLTRHPVLLDELLDNRLLETTQDWPAFASDLQQQLDAAEPDTEHQMDILREQHHAQVFRLLAQDLAGLHTVERLADHLSELADSMVARTMETVWRKLATRHREVPRFAVIAYGKLGGKELGYASDLDIVFLYDDDHPNAEEIYARYAQRLNTWLSTRTAAGILFETDLRLRPNGDAGLMVTSMAAFRKYQLEAAWVWEHQALTRARHACGDRAVGDAFEAIRIEVLRQQRDLAALRNEVLAMRARMMEAHQNRSGLFDLKHDRGGLIDVEFIVQYLVLGHAHRFERLTGNKGNIALLGMAGELGLIPADLAGAAADAYREFRRLQHALRLNGAHYARVPRNSVAVHAEAVAALWEQVMGGELPAAAT